MFVVRALKPIPASLVAPVLESMGGGSELERGLSLSRVQFYDIQVGLRRPNTRKTFRTVAVNAKDLDALTWKATDGPVVGVYAIEDVEGILDPFRYVPVGNYISRRDYFGCDPHFITESNGRPGLYLFDAILSDLFDGLVDTSNPGYGVYKPRGDDDALTELLHEAVAYTGGAILGGYATIASPVEGEEDIHGTGRGDFRARGYYAKHAGNAPRGTNVVLEGLDSFATRTPIDCFTHATVWTGPHEKYNIALEELPLGKDQRQRLDTKLEDLNLTLTTFRQECMDRFRPFRHSLRRDGTNLGDALAKIPTNRGAVFTRFYAGDMAFLAGWNDWNFSAKEEARRAGEAMGKTFPVQLEQEDGGSPALPSITLVGLPEQDQLELRQWGLEERDKALALYTKVAKTIASAFEKWQQLIEEHHAQIRVIETAQTRPDNLVAAPSYLWGVAGHFITAPILSPDPDSMVDGKMTAHIIEHPAFTAGHMMQTPVQLLLRLPSENNIFIELANRAADVIRLDRRVATPETLKILLGLFWLFDQAHRRQGGTLQPGASVDISFFQLAKTLWPGYAENYNSAQKRSKKQLFYQVSRFLQNVEIYNEGIDNPRLPKGTRIDGLFKFHGDTNQMDYVEFSLNAKIHAHLYGSAQERMLALHRGDVLMSRNVTQDGGVMALQVVLEQLMRVSAAKHNGELRTRGGEPHTVHGLLCKSGVIGLPTYKKNRTRTVNRFLDDCHQLVDDQVIGHFTLIGKGPDEKRKAIIKAHPDIMREYKKLKDAQKAAIKKTQIEKRLGWTARKDVA